MAGYTEINLEYGMPTSAEAMRLLQKQVESAKKDKIDCMLIIHGYGSSGKGGVISKKARQWLKAQEKNNKIKTVIFGEDFNLFNIKALEIKSRHKQLEKILNNCNCGVTVIEL